MPVHLFGRPAPLDELASLGLPMIEDAAQAFGSPAIATTGIASTFSFYPTKNLFGLGDGGLVAASDAGARRARSGMLRFHGSQGEEDVRVRRLQLAPRRDAGRGPAHLPARSSTSWTRARREAADRYRELGLGELVEPPGDEPGHVYHLFVCRSPQRDAIREALSRAEIGTAHYYLPPLHLQPALAYLGYGPASLPETEQLAAENFSVPLWAGIDAATAGAGRRRRARRGRRVPSRDPDQPAPALAARASTRVL